VRTRRPGAQGARARAGPEPEPQPAQVLNLGRNPRLTELPLPPRPAFLPALQALYTDPQLSHILPRMFEAAMVPRAEAPALALLELAPRSLNTPWLRIGNMCAGGR